MLKNRLQLLFLGAILAPLLIAFLVGYQVLSGELEKSQQRSLATTSAAILQDLEGQRLQLLARARETANDPELLAAVRNGNRQGLLSRLTSLMILTGVGQATFLDAEGRVVARGHSPGKYGELEATATRWMVLQDPRPRSGFAAQRTGIELEALVPLFDGDGFRGVLDLSVKLDHAMLATLREKYGVELSVFRRDRLQSTTLHDPSVLRLAASGEPSGPLEVTIDGEAHSLLEVPLEGRDDVRLGTLQVFLSHRRIDRLQSTLLAVLLSLIATLLLAVAWLARRTSRSIVEPLGRLADQADKLAEGDCTVQVPDDGPGEIAQLARAFNRMVSRLRSSTTSIDQLHREMEERQRAETALRTSREDLRITLNSIGDAVLATDRKGRVTSMNPAAVALTGWTEDDALGRELQEVVTLVDAASRAPKPSPVDQVLSDGEVTSLVDDTLLIARDGTERRIAESGSPIHDGDGEVVGVVLAIRDMTKRFELEASLRQAQKMETIGQLAGGVAHDFNNMLMGITGSAELLEDTLPASAEAARTHIETILEMAGRASELTTKLLAFSRQGQMISAVVDMDAIVGETIAILGRSIDKRIELRSELEAEHSSVDGDPTQLQGVLLNLCINARDAMPVGGRLTICARNERLDDKHIALDLSPGLYLTLEVKDTGFGMDALTVERIFEPFYTTKESGKGSGLGLSAAYGVVRSHHGMIECESEPGSGTTFTVRLPVSLETVPEEVQGAAAVAPGRGTVLLVDDEEALCRVGAAMLANLGYEATAISDPGDALELFANEADSFDLVMLDMVMPKMNGVQLYQAMMKIRPETRVVFASGYADDPEIGRLLDDPSVVGFLRKPYGRRELARLLAQALGPSGTGRPSLH